MSAKASGYVKALVVCPNGEPITAREKLVAMVLADSHQDKAKRFTYPSVETIAAEAICDKRTCQRYLDSLERKGVLLRLRPANQGRTYTVFYFFPELDEIPEGWQDTTLSSDPVFVKRVAKGRQKGGRRVATETPAILERAREQELQQEQRQKQHPPTPSTSEGERALQMLELRGSTEAAFAPSTPVHEPHLASEQRGILVHLGRAGQFAEQAMADPAPAGNAARGMWSGILDDLQERVNKHSFDTWLRPTMGASIEGDTLIVAVPTEDFQYVGDKYGELIRELIESRGLGIRDFCLVAQESRPVNLARAAVDIAMEQLKTELSTVQAARSWVIRQCGFVDRRRKRGIGSAIEAVLRQECGGGKTLLDVAPKMAEAWKNHVGNGEFLRIQYGPVKFFEVGIWKNAQGWAWDREKLAQRRNAFAGSR